MTYDPAAADWQAQYGDAVREAQALRLSLHEAVWLLAEARWRADRLRASALGSHGTGPDPAYDPHPWDDYEPHCTDTA